jgi:hypothetical protein
MQLVTQRIDMCGGCWYQTGAIPRRVTRSATLPPERLRRRPVGVIEVELTGVLAPFVSYHMGSYLVQALLLADSALSCVDRLRQGGVERFLVGTRG